MAARVSRGEWERTHCVALERIRVLMARGEDIVLDDTNWLRRLRDRYTQIASENGYAAELVYLEVSLKDLKARMVRNKVTAARATIESKVFEKHVREFEPPQADEVATVLHNAEDVARWIDSTKASP